MKINGPKVIAKGDDTLILSDGENELVWRLRDGIWQFCPNETKPSPKPIGKKRRLLDFFKEDGGG